MIFSLRGLLLFGLLCGMTLAENVLASKRLNELEALHRESSWSWARSTSESAAISLRVKRQKEAFEKRLRGVMRRKAQPVWRGLLEQSSLLDWISHKRMLRQIARYDQATLKTYQQDLNRIAKLRREQEDNLTKMRSRRDKLLTWRDNYVASRWRSRISNQDNASLIDDSNKRWKLPIEGRVLNLRYLGKASRPGLFFLSRFGTPVQSVFDGTVLYAGDVKGLGKAVIVQDDERVGIYAHLSQLKTKRRAKVATGTVVGLSGDMPGQRVSGLYFELRQEGVVSKLRLEE